MSKTLTEIAQIVSKIEDDLYEKSDEMVALQRRIRELVQQCEKLREERNTVRVKVEQPLLLRIRELEREARYLRAYGNKDCTAMADEAIANNELEQPR